MTLNIPNLGKLIAHLEAQPPERINMGHEIVQEHPCGTCGCIIGHAFLVWGFDWFGDESVVRQLAKRLGLSNTLVFRLTHPENWHDEKSGAKRYPAHRVIATLKRLRDRFLATGEIVVDWGPEPGSEPAQPWAAPQARELTPPALPETITRFLAAEPVTTGTEGR